MLSDEGRVHNAVFNEMPAKPEAAKTAKNIELPVRTIHLLRTEPLQNLIYQRPRQAACPEGEEQSLEEGTQASEISPDRPAPSPKKRESSDDNVPYTPTSTPLAILASRAESASKLRGRALPVCFSILMQGFQFSENRQPMNHTTVLAASISRPLDARI